MATEICRSQMNSRRKVFIDVALSSTDYVLMKKHNQPFDFQCVKCIKGIIVSATDGQHLLTGATRRRD
jgi:hypothetical protein